MKTYLFQVPAEARGYQCYTVEAKTEEDARELLKKGKGEFYEEELEVYDLEFNNAHLYDVLEYE